MISRGVYRFIEKVSAIGVIASLILHFQIRSLLSLEGETTGSSASILQYATELDYLFIFLHLIAAICFLPQLAQRSKLLAKDVLPREILGFSHQNRKMKIIWAGVSWPIFIGLIAYAFYTLFMLSPEELGSKPGTWMIHTLFLMQVYYVCWAFSRHGRTMLRYDTAANEEIT